MKNDIIGRNVVDLGCGTGRLAIGAALLGAKEAVGVDIDKTAVRLARGNAIKLGVNGKTQWLAADIDVFHGIFDIVLQNPPFGVQKRRTDRKFLQKSLEIAPRTHSLHKGENKREPVEKPAKGGTRVKSVSPFAFLNGFIEERGRKVLAAYAMVMTIPYMFKFHRKLKHRFVVDWYVIEGKGSFE